MTINLKTTKKTYVSVSDVYKSVEDALSYRDNTEFKQYFDSIGPKKQTACVHLLLSDIIDKKVVLSRGIIHTQSSSLIALFKDTGLALLEAERAWWFLFDCVKDLVDQDNRLLKDGIWVGKNFYLRTVDEQVNLQECV